MSHVTHLKCAHLYRTWLIYIPMSHTTNMILTHPYRYELGASSYLCATSHIWTWLIYMGIGSSTYVRVCAGCRYGVATISRLLKIMFLFCKRALWKRRYSAKETYKLKESTDRSHPISPVTHMNESCRTYEWVMPYIWMSHGAHMKKSCHTYEWVMPHTWTIHATYMNESCHTYAWVMARMCTCHLVMSLSEHSRTYEWVMTRAWHLTHTHTHVIHDVYETCDTHVTHVVFRTHMYLWASHLSHMKKSPHTYTHIRHT